MKTITAKEFDKKFDNDEDISDYLDFSNAIKLSEFEKTTGRTKKINVDFPEHIITLLDKEAQKRGVTKQKQIILYN